MKKKLYTKVFAALTAAALCMSGCGSTEETTAEETTTEATESTAAETTETAESTETTVEESAEPEITFAEENEIVYSDERSFTIPSNAVITALDISDSGNLPSDFDPVEDIDEVLTVAASEGGVTYAFGEATVSEPDSDGMVTITVSASAQQPLTFTQHNATVGYTYNWNTVITSPTIFDTYTGQAFDPGAMVDNDAAAAAVDVTYNDTVYTISLSKEVTWGDVEWGEWSDFDSNEECTIDCTRTISYTYTMTIPQDYDGLCFAFWPTSYVPEINTESTTDEANVEQTLEEKLAEDDLTLDDVAAYVRVSDLLAQ